MIIKPPRGTQLNMSHPLNRGLVACYDFNELSGNIVNDISGFRNHGDLINSPSWTPNIFGGGLEFIRASTQYVDAGVPLGNTLGNGVKALSVSLFFKVDDTSINSGLFAITAFTGNHGAIQLKINNNFLYLTFNNLSFSRTIPFSDTDNWYHLVAMYTGSKGILYLDGTITTINTNHSTDLNLSGKKTIIGGYYNTTRTFDGQIDLVRIYNRVLLESEIRQLSLRPNDVYLKDNIASWVPDGPVFDAILKRYNGSSWEKAKLQRYNGAAFENATLKYFDTTWKTVDTTGI